MSVHGTLATARPAATGTLKASILVCHGALDPHVPSAQLSEFMSEMNSARADWELVVLGGALHGFTHTGATGENGVAYDPGADARSFRAITGFLDEAFRSRVNQRVYV